ncbi:tetratricopeptide repeat protein [Akkermansia sp.]|uniref:tetratricopeptide repeat protein n=1 Tax=Akkermansia sp. TaxID=1872421 RepID=UPI003A8CD21A
MKQKEFISRFSPNQTSPEVLEKMLVQRSSMIDDAVALCVESIDTPEKHHLLFVGPRGIGKTHLLTLLNHRLEQTKTKRKYWVAWLNEDKTKASFLQLIRQIHEALSSRYPDAFPAEDIEEMKQLSLKSIEYEWKKLLLLRMKKHTVLVLMENLDAAFKDMKPVEQKKWRSFIQDSRLFSTVATAQSLTDYFTDYGEPFYGFFKTWHLKPLTAEESSELLKNIAELNGNTAMINYLESLDGRARIYALHCLSGGNPRLYVVLSGILARQDYGNHGTIEEFEEMVDQQLTPYYQERLRWISSQQREIVEYLCSQNSPVPVKTISRETFIPHTTLTSQLKSLKELGYVVSSPHGRESFYELSEPLMRIAMQVKDARGMQPLKTIVDFLQIWYRQEELERMVAEGSSGGIPIPRRMVYAETACREMRLSSESLCFQILRESVQSIDAEKCSEEEFKKLHTIVCWRNNIDSETILKYARACMRRGKYQESIEYSTRIIEDDNSETTDIAEALYNVELSHFSLGNILNAITICTRIIGMKGVEASLIALALVDRGVDYWKLGEKEKALEDYTRVIELDGAGVSTVARALIHRGNAYSRLGEKKKALEDYTRVIELDGADASTIAWALLKRGDVYSGLEEKERALEDYTRVTELDGADASTIAWALLNRGDVYSYFGEKKKALEDYTEAIKLDGANVSIIAWALLNRGDVYSYFGKKKKALKDYARVIELEGVEIFIVSFTLKKMVLLNYNVNTESWVEKRRWITELENEKDYSEIAIVCLRAAFAVRRKGSWEKRMDGLIKVLEHGNIAKVPAYGLLAQAVVDEMMNGASSGWLGKIRKVVEVFAQHEGGLIVLGNALVRELKELKVCEFNESELNCWVSAWTRAAKGCKEMTLPLRLLSAGVEWIKSGSDKAFLSLNLQERPLVYAALELEEEK